jgi:TetR/AcrR family transcriptional regulator, mexJK operon transcriptional repressor
MPSQSVDATGTERPSRGTLKRAAILRAAQELFFANGFLGTSMDQIAATAAVSKQTVYKHFSDKEGLFRDVVTEVVRANDGGIPAGFLAEGEESIEQRLRIFSRHFLKGVMQPDVLQLRRLVIGEVGRFPELGQVFYELGPKRAADQLALALGAAAEQHALSGIDPEVAAEHLLSLILSRPLERSMLLGDEIDLTEASLNKIADDGVTAFVHAYGLSAQEL